jgi:hypothetical protein
MAPATVFSAPSTDRNQSLACNLDVQTETVPRTFRAFVTLSLEAAGPLPDGHPEEGLGTIAPALF